MNYSLIIPTYNRVDELRELIPTIEHQSIDKSKFELIIVDDGSTDQTNEFISNLDTRIIVQYLIQKNKGPGAARNLGMEHANGKYFIFVDSDCLLPQDFFLNIDNYIKNEKVDAFGGADTFHPSFSPLLKAINYSMTSFLGTGGTRGNKKSIDKFYPRSFNMGLHRKVYETIGGFGNLRHGQDMDYSARIYEAGFKVSLIPDNPVYHKRRTSIKKFFKQIYNWGIARINLSSLHPGFLKPVHLAPALAVFLSGAIIILAIVRILPFIIFQIWIAFAVLIAIITFVQSFQLYKNLWISVLSIITLFTQVLAYGLGSLSGLLQRFVFRKKESKGFVKNYYK